MIIKLILAFILLCVVAVFALFAFAARGEEEVQGEIEDRKLNDIAERHRKALTLHKGNGREW